MHIQAYVALICLHKVSIKITRKQLPRKKKKKVWKRVDGDDEDRNISIISFLTIAPTAWQPQQPAEAALRLIALRKFMEIRKDERKQTIVLTNCGGARSHCCRSWRLVIAPPAHNLISINKEQDLFAFKKIFF